MEETFVAFYKSYHNYVEAKKPKNVLKCAVKLAEETGEVAEAVSAFMGNERKTTKLAKENHTPQDRLEEELSDVIIVALNLAVAAKLDLKKMLQDAISKMDTKAAKRKSEKTSKE
jgi:NTP pyrophosphatase (non-canonical NTP hydrolase)